MEWAASRGIVSQRLNPQRLIWELTLWQAAWTYHHQEHIEVFLDEEPHTTRVVYLGRGRWHAQWGYIERRGERLLERPRDIEALLHEAYPATRWERLPEPAL